MSTAAIDIYILLFFIFTSFLSFWPWKRRDNGKLKCFKIAFLLKIIRLVILIAILASLGMSLFDFKLIEVGATAIFSVLFLKNC